MASLKETRNRISSVKSTQQITKAMKMVAAAKLRRAQDRIVQMRPYADRLGNILSNLSESMEGDLSSEFLQERSPEKVLVVAITSDRGLCGAFNANVVKACVNLVEEKYAAQAEAGNLSFLNMGRKGFESLKRQDLKVNDDYVNIFQELSFQKAKDAGEYILDLYRKKEIDRVEVVFNEFKNVVTQIVRTQQLLPLEQDMTEVGNKQDSVNDYIFEPSKLEILDELIPKILKVQLYRSILESNASEHGARMTSMDNATENANELLKDLKLMYNRSRQAAITKEILEIVAGAEALGN